MNKYRTITVLLLAVLWTAASQAQNPMIHFGYDANGNRTSRTLSIRKIEENGRLTDTTNTLAMLDVAHDTFGKASLTLYPNPTHGKVSIILQGIGNGTVTASLVSTTGATLQRCEISDGIHDFDLSGLPGGVYLLRLSASEVSQTWKIIKQ